MTSIEDLIGRERCCEKDTGGSHYHCGRCGGVSGMQGHYTSLHRVPDRKQPGFAKFQRVEFHHHCPAPYGCALDEADASP